MNSRFGLLLILVSLVLSVSFYTLTERKILALTQNRLGPTKILFYGLGQPLLDGVKLLKKVVNINIKISFFIYNFFCCFMLLVSVFLWFSIPFKSWSFSKSLMVMWVLSIISVNSFSILMLGWSSLSKYSFMGAVRSVCQTISLEVVLILLFFSLFMLLGISILSIGVVNFIKPYFLLYCHMAILIILFIMETHRAPFDLSEGESEIVSGYNTEFSSVLFILIFLSEYMSLLFMFTMLAILFMKVWTLSGFICLALMIRSCFPRVRYDLLMTYTWMKLLPGVIIISFIFLSLKIML